jgi:hypothetical protein
MDLYGALIRDLQPRFPVPRQLRASSLDVPKESNDAKVHPLISALEMTSPLLRPVATTLRQLSNIATIINGNWHRSGFLQLDMKALPVFIPVTHRLLSMRRLSENLAKGDMNLTLLNEILRLSCLILLGGLKASLMFSAREMPVLQKQLRGLVGWDLSGLDQDLRRAELWAIVTSALIQSEEREIFVMEIRRIMTAIGLASGRDAIDVARSFVWIESVHSKEVENLSREIDDSEKGAAVIIEPSQDRTGV